MILQISAEGEAQLLQPGDLTRLSCELHMQRRQLTDAQTGLSSIVSFEQDNAWISIAWLRNAGTGSQDSGWPQRFDQMIAKAKPHGWVSEDNQSVKAHVVWTETA